MLEANPTVCLASKCVSGSRRSRHGTRQPSRNPLGRPWRVGTLRASRHDGTPTSASRDTSEVSQDTQSGRPVTIWVTTHKSRDVSAEGTLQYRLALGVSGRPIPVP
eukprot:2216963-Prymnesium_polylepis.1